MLLGVALQSQMLFGPGPMFREVTRLGLPVLRLVAQACFHGCPWLRPASAEVSDFGSVQQRSPAWAFSFRGHSLVVSEVYACTLAVLLLENIVSLDLSTTPGSYTVSVPTSTSSGRSWGRRKIFTKIHCMNFFFLKKTYILVKDTKVDWVLGVTGFGMSALIKEEVGTSLKYEKSNILGSPLHF